MRWVVGDVHGCAAELERLLRKIRFDPQRDELWSVGDLVNTGPDSLEVLSLWRDLGGRAVLGNHDIYALRVFDGARGRRADDTLDELLESPDAGELLDRLGSRPVLARLPGGDGVRGAWIVHAGLDPRWTDLEATARSLDERPRDEAWRTDPRVAFATRVRCCTAEGEMSDDPGPPDHCRAPFRPWDEFYRGEELIVHGHWAMRGHYRSRATMSLDSGCVYGGRLSAWCQEEDRVVKVRAGTGRRT